MQLIKLKTKINSTLEICFDLSRSIDLHEISTAHTNEKAVDGVTTGLINLNEFVTWQAKHFGITQKLTSQITAYNRPFHFRDEQIKGAFKYIVHDHYFETKNGCIIMNDVFSFQSPFGFLGGVADKIVLKKYLTKLLVKRNAVIKEFAETNKWKELLIK